MFIINRCIISVISAVSRPYFSRISTVFRRISGILRPYFDHSSAAFRTCYTAVFRPYFCRIFRPYFCRIFRLYLGHIYPKKRERERYREIERDNSYSRRGASQNTQRRVCYASLPGQGSSFINHVT